MIVSTTNCATSGGLWVIDLYENWKWHWVREWRDLGRLIEMQYKEEHIERHDIKAERWPFNADNDWCECFRCRVERAWKRRHDPPMKVKEKKRR